MRKLLPDLMPVIEIITRATNDSIASVARAINARIDEFDKRFASIPAGPPGPKGEQGERGPQGEIGIRGEVGPRGESGASVSGPKGEQGPAGAKGETGERGERGASGEAGAQGIQGERGEQGPIGERGIQGEAGPEGKIGPEGQRGAQGERGEVGPKGEQGERGATGERGECGARGEQGIPGERGLQGERGLPGHNGEKGERGPGPSTEEISSAVEREFSRFALDCERRIQELADRTLQRAIDKFPLPKDGIDGKPGRDALDIEDLNFDVDEEGYLLISLKRGEISKEWRKRLPMVADKGTYKADGKYLRQNGVTHRGSFWIAQVDNPSETPGTGSQWRMAVKAGRDAAKGEKGDKGDKGDPGQDLRYK